MQKLTTLSSIALLTLAGLVSACSPSQPTPAAKEQPAAPKPITADERVKWYQDCWNDFSQHKWDEFKKCYADNAQAIQMGYGKPTVTGPDAIVGSSEDFVKAFPDGRGENQLILVNGPHIASISILKGTSAANNKKFGVLFGHEIDAEENALKVVKEIGVQDGATIAAQLGMMKMPSRPVMESGETMPKIVIAKNDETEKKNIETDMAMMDAWSKHDLKATQMLEADDVVVHDTTQAKDMNKAANDADAQEFWKGFSDAKLNASSMWAAGDYVAVVANFDGTNDGDFPKMNLKKTGKHVSLPFLEIDRFDAGKVKEVWLFFDGMAFAQQLGLIPPK